MIVEDHEMFRDGMGIILSQIENFELAAAVGSGREMKKILKEEETVQIVLMDVKLKGETANTNPSSGRYSKRFHIPFADSG